MANINWTSSSGGLWSNPNNWSTSTVPSGVDNVYFASGFSNFACTIDTSPTVLSLTTSGSYSGALSWASQVLTVSGNLTLDGSGTLNLGNGITCNGASSNLHIGSTVGTVTATSCAITMNTLTAGVIDDDKGITAKSLTLGASAVVTNSGGATTTLSPGVNSIPVVLGNSASLTVNSMIQANITGTTALITLGASYTLTGTNRIQWQAAAGTYTCPAITANWPVFYFEINGAGTFNLAGDLVFISAATIIRQGSSGAFVFNTNNYAMTFSDFRIGNNNVAGSTTFNVGSSVCIIGGWNSGTTYNVGTTNINLQTSQWTCSGPWTFGSNHTVAPGTSVINIVPTTNTNITSASKAFATINFSGTNPLVTGFFVDQPIISGNLGVYGGISVNTSGLTIPITSGCYITSSGNFTSSGIYNIGKDLTFGSGTVLNNTNQTLNLSGQAHTITTGGRNFPYTKVYDNSTWIGSGTLARLSLYAPTISTTHTWQAGAPYRFTSYTANDWNGTDLNHQILFRSSAAGFQSTFYAPLNTITRFTDYKDINNLGVEIDASDGTSTDAGNNYGINFGGLAVHPDRRTDKNDAFFFIATKTFKY